MFFLQVWFCVILILHGFITVCVCAWTVAYDEHSEDNKEPHDSPSIPGNGNDDAEDDGVHDEDAQPTPAIVTTTVKTTPPEEDDPEEDTSDDVEYYDDQGGQDGHAHPEASSASSVTSEIDK